MYYAFDANQLKRIWQLLRVHGNLLNNDNIIRVVDGKILEIKFEVGWKIFDIDLGQLSAWVINDNAKWDPPWTREWRRRLETIVKCNRPKEYIRMTWNSYVSIHQLESVLQKVVNPGYSSNVQVRVRRDVENRTVSVTFGIGRTQSDVRVIRQVISEDALSRGDDREIAALLRAMCDRAMVELNTMRVAPAQTTLAQTTPSQALPIIAEMNRPRVEVKATSETAPTNSISQLPGHAAHRFELLEPAATPAKATTTFVVARQTQKQLPAHKEAQPVREFSRAELLELDNHTKVCQAEPVVNERGALLEMD